MCVCDIALRYFVAKEGNFGMFWTAARLRRFGDSTNESWRIHNRAVGKRLGGLGWVVEYATLVQYGGLQMGDKVVYN